MGLAATSVKISQGARREQPSACLFFFFADAEDITSGPALVRERGGLVPTDVCARTDEGFRALCRRSLSSLLPKLFSAGLPNPS